MPRNQHEKDVSKRMWLRRGSPTGQRPKNCHELDVERARAEKTSKSSRDQQRPELYPDHCDDPDDMGTSDDHDADPSVSVREGRFPCSSESPTFARTASCTNPSRDWKRKYVEIPVPEHDSDSESKQSRPSYHHVVPIKEPESRPINSRDYKNRDINEAAQSAESESSPTTTIFDLLSILLRNGTRSTYVIIGILAALLLVLLALICTIIILHSLPERPSLEHPALTDQESLGSDPLAIRSWMIRILRLLPDILQSGVGRFSRGLHSFNLVSESAGSRSTRPTDASSDAIQESDHHTQNSTDSRNSTPFPAILPKPTLQIHKINFDRFSCYDQINHYLCVDRTDGSCVLVFSSYPSSRLITVVELDRRISFVSESDQEDFDRYCRSTIYRYVPVS